MSDLDETLNDAFSGFVVRKDLAGDLKGSSQVPTYVLEYLLAQYAASDDEAIIREGTEDVRGILAEHYVDPANAQLVRSRILERGRYRIIDKVNVTVNEKNQTYEARFQNLNLSGVEIDSHTVTQNEKLLVGGVWCLVDLEYFGGQDPSAGSPWVLSGLKPIQLANFDMDSYLEGRARFDSEQWLDALVQSIGLDPSFFTKRGKLLQLTRLIPYVENNYNLVELGPKGTGKSHIYTEFSPHGMLISGGEVTVPKLFVNNATRQVGLLGYWDVVAFDEFAGQDKRVDKSLVDIMKNYMANRSFSRGTDIHTAPASMAFIGNTSATVPYMLKNSDLFQDLPDAYHDSAYLDRVHFYLPGWEIDPIRGELFTEGYGFVVDYLAEAFKDLRRQDYSDKYREHFTLDPQISTRDREAIHKTFSGLMKLLHPSGEATKDEIEELLSFAIEGRKRVKDQIVRIDPTMHAVPFSYEDASGTKTSVTTLEEDEYPEYYHKVAKDPAELEPIEAEEPKETRRVTAEPEALAEADLETGDSEALNTGRTKHPRAYEGSKKIKENQRGVSYKRLFGPWLEGARNVLLIDPYIRQFYQARNLMEFVQLLTTLKDPADTVNLLLVTGREMKNEEWRQKQEDLLSQVVEEAALGGINLTVEFEEGLHDRHIYTDTGWQMTMGRGLDIFQPFENSPLSLAHRLQEHRRAKAFSIFYTRET